MREPYAMKVQLNDEEKRRIADEITAFYRDVRGDEIGIIEQQQILDLFLDELAPIVYNKALDEAKKWYVQQQNNMEADFYVLYKDI